MGIKHYLPCKDHCSNTNFVVTRHCCILKKDHDELETFLQLKEEREKRVPYESLVVMIIQVPLT